MSIFNASSRELGRWERHINALRDQRMNESGLERADAQQSLAELRRMQARRLADIKGRQSLGFTVNRADEKNGGNMELAQGISNIAANAAKDNWEKEKMFKGLADDIHKEKMAHIDNRLTQIANAGSEASKLFAGVAGGLVDGYKKRKKARAAAAAKDDDVNNTLTA